MPERLQTTYGQASGHLFYRIADTMSRQEHSSCSADHPQKYRTVDRLRPTLVIISQVCSYAFIFFKCCNTNQINMKSTEVRSNNSAFRASSSARQTRRQNIAFFGSKTWEPFVHQNNKTWWEKNYNREGLRHYSCAKSSSHCVWPTRLGMTNCCQCRRRRNCVVKASLNASTISCLEVFDGLGGVLSILNSHSHFLN